MKQLNEIELMNAICLHEKSLRYMNFYEKKRFVSMHCLINFVVKFLSSKISIYIIYDITCKFQSWLSKHDSFLCSRIVFYVNVFHIYNHELKCQIVWNSRVIENLNMLNKKQCEKNWSRNAHLISTKRIFNFSYREILLHQSNINKIKKTRQNVSLFYCKIFKKTYIQFVDCSKKLKCYLREIKTFDDISLNMIEFECQFRFQHKRQKQYFRQRASSISFEKNDLFRTYITRKKILVFRIKKIEFLNLVLSIINNFQRDTKIWKKQKNNVQNREKLNDLLSYFHHSIENLKSSIILTKCIHEHLHLSWKKFQSIENIIYQIYYTRVLKFCIIKFKKIELNQKIVKKFFTIIKQKYFQIIKLMKKFNQIRSLFLFFHRFSKITIETFEINHLKRIFNKNLWQFKITRVLIFQNAIRCDIFNENLQIIDILHKKNKTREKIVIINSQNKKLRK